MSLRVSILGIGKMGKNHLRVLSMLKGVVVAKIFDFNEDELKSVSEQYDVPYTLDAKEALEDVDAVIIVTPTSTHFDYFKLCVGKVTNVFIEKPLAESYAEAQEIKVLANANGMFVQCGFIERFNPVVAELKKILESTNVINADFFRTNRLSSRITDVDVVLDLMIHDLEVILHLVSSPIASIDAVGVTVLTRHEDIANARLRFENGCVANITASRISPDRMRKIRVFQEECYLSLDYQ